MRYALLAAAALLAACGQSEPPPPLPETTVQAVAAPWFICDAINAPVLLVFERDGNTARVAQYDKPNGALIQRTQMLEKTLRTQLSPQMSAALRFSRTLNQQVQ